MPNFFAFDSKEEFEELKQDTDSSMWKYEDAPDKAGTLLSPTLERHRWKSMRGCREKRFIIAFNRFNGDSSYSYTSYWPAIFKGERLIINDATDKIFCYPSYMSWVLNSKRGVYVKKNLGHDNDYYDLWKKKKNRQSWPQGPNHHLVFDTLKKRDLLLPGPESPPAGNIRAWLDSGLDFKPFKDRKYDVFFAGQTRAGYGVGDKTDQIESLKKIVKKLKLKALIIDKSQNLGRKGYMEAINNTKCCYNFSIGPLRNRREWEILLGGGLLIQDLRTHNMEKDIMIHYKHYEYTSRVMENQLESIFDAPEKYEKTAYRGFRLAQECWCNIPTLEFRLFFQYFKYSKRIRTLEELVEKETLA